MAAGTDIFLEPQFYKADTLSELLVFLNTTGSDLRLSGKSVSGNRSNSLQSARQMTGIDLCDCVDFLYRLHLLNPNNLLNLIQLLQPQSCICSVCCFRSGFGKKPFSTVCCPVHHESAVAALGKSKVPPYVPVDLLRKCKMLPCCPLLGWKIGRRKHPGEDEAVIENCWCWRQ